MLLTVDDDVVPKYTRVSPRPLSLPGPCQSEASSRPACLLGRFFPGPRQTRVLQAGQGSCNQVSFVLHGTRVSAFGKSTPCPWQSISAAVAAMIAQCCPAARARPAVSKLLYNHDCKSTLLQNIRRSQRARTARERGTESFVPQRSPATATLVGDARWTALPSLVPRTSVPPYLCMFVSRPDGSSTSPSDLQRARVTRHGRLVKQDKETSNQAPPDSFPQMFRKCPLLVAFPTVAGERGPLLDSGFCGKKKLYGDTGQADEFCCKQHRHGDVRALLDMLPRGGCDRLAYYGELGR